MEEMKKNIKIDKSVDLAGFLISRQIARDIEFLCGGIKEKSFVEETVIFTFPYQTNGNHATEPSTVGHVILTTALERYFRFD